MNSELCSCGHRYATHTYFPNRFPCLQCSCEQFNPKLLILMEKTDLERKPPARSPARKGEAPAVVRA